MSHYLRCLHYPFARQSRSRKLRRQLLVTKEKRWRFMRLDPIIPKTLQVAVLPGPASSLVDVDPKTGWVTSARMEKSTGSKLLDDAAIAAFSRWRFRPGTVRQVHSPITFTHR